MCGRYALYEAEHLSGRFNLATKPLIHVADNYNVAPGQFLPVIIRGESGNLAELMRWGLIPRWAKDAKVGYHLINTRVETVFDKPLWRQSIKHYRCLVPARGFFEWKVLAGQKAKTPFYIHPKDQDMFGFAGLWSAHEDVEGHIIKSFSILTTGPNREMTAVHNRMPVILTPGEEDSWLEPSLERQADIIPFLHPYEDNGLEIYKVSPDVNSPVHNDKHLVYRL